MAKKNMWVTHGKAERELGYAPAKAAQALAHATAWFTK
jgi:hypothetical protein